MDLERLKIERRAPAAEARAAHRARPTRRQPWFGRLVFLIALAGLAYVFQRDLLALVDRFRLPLVEAVVVQRTSPLAASAVRGTAANGYVVASRRAALSADTPGRIVAMYVTEGSVVREGEVVARLFEDEYEAVLERAEAELAALDASEARATAAVAAAAAELERLESVARERRANVDEARASFELARKQEARATRLVDEGVENLERLDTADAELARSRATLALSEAGVLSAEAAVTTGRANVEAARAEVAEIEARRGALEASRELARATLGKTEVRAPFDGIVVLKDAEVGEVVSPNSQGGSSARGSIVTMVDFDSLEVQVEVPEMNIEKVRLGAPVQIFLDARPSAPYAGRVDRIWPTANRQKSTIEVRVTFAERDEFLRPEMGARVVFDSEPDAAAPPSEVPAEPELLVPTNALVRVAGQSGVFVIERDRVAFRALLLGPERSGRRIVEGGLEPGERIVIAPPTDLQDGGRVRTAKSS